MYVYCICMYICCKCTYMYVHCKCMMYTANIAIDVVISSYLSLRVSRQNVEIIIVDACIDKWNQPQPDSKYTPSNTGNVTDRQIVRSYPLTAFIRALYRESYAAVCIKGS